MANGSSSHANCKFTANGHLESCVGKFQVILGSVGNEVSVMRDGAENVVVTARVPCSGPPSQFWSSPFMDCRSDLLIEHHGPAEESPGHI